MSAQPRGLHALAVGVLVALCGCRSTAPPPQVAPSASTEFAAARVSQGQGDLLQARESALRARVSAPEWVAPQRFLDELDREALVLPQAFERHLSTLTRDPGDAQALYLAGRLAAGDDSREYFQRAALADPEFAWAYHGLAFSASRKLQVKTAVRLERRALALARDPWERRTFATHLVRFLLAEGEADEALGVLEHVLGSTASDSRDYTALAALHIRTTLGAAENRERVEVAFRDGLELLHRRGAELAPAELVALVQEMRESGAFQSGSARSRALESALQQVQGTPGGAQALAELLLRDGSFEAARVLQQRESESPRVPGRSARLLAFRAGRTREAVEAWLASLPRLALDDAGLPRDARLRAVVTLVRHSSDDASQSAAVRGARLRDLGAALLAAGWFEEALVAGSRLAALGDEGGFEIRRRAAAALTLLTSIDELFGTIAVDGPYVGLGAERLEPLGDLLQVLGALEPLEATYRRSVPLALSQPPTRPSASPLLSQGLLGSVVDPGPGEGETAAGLPAPAPGLSALFDELVRFGLVGKGTGRLPDAVVLPTLWSERSRGAHLGAPWSGMRTLAEGRDVRALAERHGARLSGAALHDGYWVDLEAVRRDLEQWLALGVRFGPDRSGASRAAAALAVRGRALQPGERAGDWAPPLGEGDRLRLRRLVESRAGQTPAIGIDELFDVVRIHEEAHLCDRARFLPISEHLGAVLSLLWRCGLSPALVLQRLEYRAQLVALAVVSDPRVVLAEVMDSAAANDGGSAGRPTPHAAAYGQLARDLLRTLEAQGRGEGRLLVHELHALAPQVLREAALALAAREGLVEAPQ